MTMIDGFKDRVARWAAARLGVAAPPAAPARLPPALPGSGQGPAVVLPPTALAIVHREPPCLDPTPESSISNILAFQAAPHRRTLYPSGAALDLLRWLQMQSIYGWLDKWEVERAWDERHAQIGLSTLTACQVLEALAKIPDVRKRRRRIGSGETAPVLARLRRVGRLNKDNKHTLFYIPPLPEETRLAPSLDDLPGHQPARPSPPADVQPASGPRPLPPAKPSASARPARPSVARAGSTTFAERCFATLDLFGTAKEAA